MECLSQLHREGLLNLSKLPSAEVLDDHELRQHLALRRREKPNLLATHDFTKDLRGNALEVCEIWLQCPEVVLVEGDVEEALFCTDLSNMREEAPAVSLVEGVYLLAARPVLEGRRRNWGT